MSTGQSGAFVTQLSWPELERRIHAGAIAVLPVGAACKAHGPHLPMHTDLIQAEYLAAALVQRAQVLVWPAINYGYYPAFTDYPGSVSLTHDTFRGLVQQILADINRAGVHAVLIVNTGISTIDPLHAVIETMQEVMRIELVNVYEGVHYSSLLETLEQQTYGGHADEIETSIMLAIDRGLVAMDKAESWTPGAIGNNGPFSRSDPGNPNYCPAGVWGDPTLASEDKGRRLLSAIIDDLMVAVRLLGAA